MIIIVCLDDNGGMTFNHRRQSRDRAVTERIRQIARGKKLWMNSYSYKLYGDIEGAETIEAEDFLDRAGTGELCLLETGSLAGVEAKIDEVIVFGWNRTYPSDFRLDLELSGFSRTDVREFPGASHEKITEARYVRRLASTT
ncbi:MAG: ribonuclease Z [Lachnospiraceae bacterium]